MNNEELIFTINNKNISFSNDNLINLNEIQIKSKVLEGNKDNDSSMNNCILDTSYENSKENVIKLEINNKEINPIINDAYIEINSRNIFTKIKEKYIYEMDKKFKKIYFQNNESLSKLSQLSDSIKENLIEFLYPKKKSDFFQLSHQISKIMKKQKFLQKSNLEENIKYFFTNRVYFKYAQSITIDKKFIINCGFILCYAYHYLNNSKIKDAESFIKVINEIKQQNTDLLKDYLFYCNNKGIKPEYIEKFKYFNKSMKKQYPLIPELIILINMLNLCTKIIIDFDFEGEKFTPNELHLFYITLLNIKYIVKDLKFIKLNLINRNIQYGIYGVYSQKIIRDSKLYHYFKKNNTKFKRYIYKEKWNFEKDFALEYHKNRKIQKEFYYNIDNIFNLDDINIEDDIFNDKKISKNSKNTNKKKSDKIFGNYFKSTNSSHDDSELNPNESQKRRSCFIPSSSKANKLLLSKEDDKNSIDKLIDYYKDVVDDCIYILEMIFVALTSLNNMENLEQIELLFNESYFYEYNSFFRNICKINIGNSHILDFIYNKVIKMTSLSFEINFFYFVTINRLFKILYNNDNISSLKFSMFSSDCTYFPEAIYKIYNQNIIHKSMKIIENEHKKDLYCCLEDNFFKNIFPYFEKYLNYFFLILKDKHLKTLGLNINIPCPILNNEKYIIIIFKFILNIILLSIDDVKSCIEELTILSLNLVVNGHKIIFLDKFLENIKNNNKSLLNLNFQMTLYNVMNIHKLIGNNLKILNIGDFDIFSLRHFVFNITQYNFCKNSSLEQISISLNKIIKKFDDIIKVLIAKLFYIKIRNLLSINIYTNIEINNKKDFQDILTLIKDNWVSTYLIIFNPKSYIFINNSLKEAEISDINYLAYKNRLSNINNKDGLKIVDYNNISDEIFFYLKYIINKNYGSNVDYFSKKKIISNILKYIYSSKNATLRFNFEEDKKIII